MNSSLPKLALGPVLYYWSREFLLDFYERMAQTAVDIIYLGETVCSKRKTLRTSEWLMLAERLTAAGKEVVLSTLTLLEAESELKTLQRLCNNGQFMVEANDMAAVQLLKGTPFVAGSGINIYNPRALAFLAKLGLQRWVFPLELSREVLADFQAQRPPNVATEVLVYGRLPLAYSARCFTARAHNLPKDDCQYRCLDYPDGLTLATQEGNPFLILNGIQTQSAPHCNLLPALATLQSWGIEVLRISPQSQQTEKVIKIFRAALDEPQTLAEGMTQLQRCSAFGHCDGYWHGHAGIDFQTQTG